MKKQLLAFFFLCCCPAYAIPVFNPGDASLLRNGIFFCGKCSEACDPYLAWCDYVSFRAGFYGDYVFNRNLRAERKGDGDHLDHSFIATNAALITLNVCDRIDLFTTLGSSNICLNGNGKLFSADPEIANLITNIETATDFSWSVGLRGTIWRWDCTILGMEAQYFSTDPDLFRVTNADQFAVYPALNHVQYREWQIGIGITQSLADIAYPYIAFKYSRAHIDTDEAEPYGASGPITPGIPFIIPDFESAKSVGYVVGLTLLYFDTLSFTLEGRFADEKALHVNAEVRF